MRSLSNKFQPIYTRLMTRMSWGVGLVSALFFLLYLLTGPKTIVGYGDSDLFITLAHYLGAAHPPGYSLYLTMLHLWQRLPIGLELAYLSQIMHVLIASMTMGMVFASCWRLFDHLKPKIRSKKLHLKPQVQRFYLSVLTTLTTGTSFLYWLYAGITQPWILSAFFVALLMYLTIEIQSRKKISVYRWMMVFVVIGLAISHQHALVVMAAAPLFLFYKQVRRKQASDYISLVGLPLGLVMSLILIIGLFNKGETGIGWQIDSGLGGAAQFMSQAEFTGFRSNEPINLVNAMLSFDLNQATTAVIEFVKLTLSYYGAWLVVLLVVAVRSGRKHPMFLTTVMPLVGLLLYIGMIGWPQDHLVQAQLQAQYLLIYPALALLTWFGWQKLLEKFTSAANVLTSNSRSHFVAIILLFTPIIYPLVVFYPQINLSDYSLVYDVHQELLQRVEPDSFVVCLSELSCYALFYQNMVLDKRSDVVLLPVVDNYTPGIFDREGIRNFAYTQNPYLILDAITWNLDERPVYVVGVNQEFRHLLGIDYGFMYYLPQGSFGRLSRQMPEDLLPPLDAPVASEFRQAPVPRVDKMRQYHYRYIANQHVTNSLTYLMADERQLAQDELHLASSLYHQLPSPADEEIVGIRSNIEQLLSRENFSPGTQVDEAQVFLDYIPDLLEGNFYSQALLAAQGAVLVEPENLEARLTLADLYLEVGDLVFARIEYQNVLILDPENEQAKESLNRL